jgi:hypothetical protein
LLVGPTSEKIDRVFCAMHAKSDLSRVLDELQTRLRPTLKEWGFRVRGRTFNRTTPDGLTEVLNLQAGSFDPPGTTYIPGLRENLHGKFAVNLGIFVPEVAGCLAGGGPRSFIQEYHCSIRARLRVVGSERKDIWWDTRSDEAMADELLQRFRRDAIPFFEAFDTPDKILSEWQEVAESPYFGSPPRIVCAIVLTKRGRVDEARAVPAEQAKETRNPGHPAYVRELVEKLGLGKLEP